MIQTPTRTSLGSFPIEKLDANSGAFFRVVVRFHVGDPAGEDSCDCPCSRDTFWHSQKHMNRQPHKYRVPGHKVNSSRRYIYGFRLVAILQMSVNRAKDQRNLQSIAVRITTIRCGHGCPLSSEAASVGRDQISPSPACMGVKLFSILLQNRLQAQKAPKPQPNSRN
jgi:hypothetical protein